MVVSGSPPASAEVKRHFAKESAYLPVLKEVRWPKDGTVHRFATTSAKVVGTLWAPMGGKVEFARFIGDREGVLITTIFTVESFQLGPVSQEVFDYNMPPGSIIRDETTGERCRVGASGEKLLLD